MFKLLTILLSVSPLVLSQSPGTQIPEVHPVLPWEKCEKGGHCTAAHGEVVMDANWRWIHDGKSQACYNGNQRNAAVCTTEDACAKACMMEGVGSYQTTNGVSTTGNSLRLNFLTKHDDGSHTVGSRLYFMANASHYEMFKLLAQEMTFDVDMSTLPCGTNAAFYLVSMDGDGGSAKHPNNKAGAKYGTGYCDAQCPKVDHFVEGQPGACCAEMDIWEANSMATAYTLHPCDPVYKLCTGDACGHSDRYATSCDPDGCGFNSYQMGNHSFYGPGLTVDTKKVFTVVTQFITSDGTAAGHLTEVRRFYVQGGKVIPNSMSKITGQTGNAVTEEYCSKSQHFTKHGGVKKMGDALKEGMVLTFSLWEDAGGHMLWLDANSAGPCPTSSGVASELEKNYPNSYVAFSNLKVGPIDSTFPAHA